VHQRLGVRSDSQPSFSGEHRSRSHTRWDRTGCQDHSKDLPMGKGQQRSVHPPGSNSSSGRGRIDVGSSKGPSDRNDPPAKSAPKTKATPAIDAHFHIDRLIRWVDSTSGKKRPATPRSRSLAAVLQRADTTAALSCPLQFAIASFCDPDGRERFLQAAERKESWLECDPKAVMWQQGRCQSDINIAGQGTQWLI
jgi:hypothetical protein